MILITFLGTGDYKTANYQLGDRTRQTALFPTTMPEFFPELTAAKVFVTPQAEAKHGADLREQWPTEWNPEFVPIPSGATTDELWQIFDAIVAAVPRDERVVFDITHAFRSIPLISVLAVAFLWSTRNVRLHALVYGAYDAKVGDPPVAPVFDLTPMVNLLEWLSAVERFRHHLDGTPLHQLLDRIQRQAHADQSPDAPRKLQSAGNQLGQLTDALLLGRVREVLREVPRLRQSLDNPVLATEAGRWAKPLTLMLEPINQLLDEIGSAPELDLAAHHRLARLYAERRLFMPAITVFREWVVSRAGQLAGLTGVELAAENRRTEIERDLGRCIQAKRDGSPLPAEPAWLSTAEGDGLIQLWMSIPHIRNDVDHAGMKKEAKTASVLINNIRSLVLGETLVDDPSHPHVTFDVSTLYAATATAKLADLPSYEQAAKDAVPPGADVTLTGAGPVWLYLKIGHALHGRARRLMYDSPVTGSLVVFDHSPT
jgi:CRISPR-associated DxTHG motif protein